jgi:hypothetical protein
MARATGDQLVRQLQALPPYLHIQLGRARDIAARPVKAGDQAELHRIAVGRKYDGN